MSVSDSITLLYVQCNQSVLIPQGILVQKLVYGSPPPATALEEEDIEQALALDAD